MPKIIKDGVVYGASPSENVWEGTMAEYNAIPVKDPNTAYYITDEDPYPNTNAGVISYDNTNSGLSAVNVQQAIDEISIKSATFTPESGVEVMHISTGYADKYGCISGEIRFTQTANAWKTLGTLTIKPNDICQVPGVHTGSGAFLGIVRLQKSGELQVYPIINVSNSPVGFSISFITS